MDEKQNQSDAEPSSEDETGIRSGKGSAIFSRLFLYGDKQVPVRLSNIEEVIDDE